MHNIRVELGAASYDICIGTGLRDALCAFVRQAGFSRKALLVSDSHVGKIYGQAVRTGLQEAGLEAEFLMVPAGESSKSLGEAERIYTRAIEIGLDRKSAIFALGGGVVGDLVGFVAATYMRGLPFVQLPTSLLAQVDSSVGGKVAVNHRLGKNLIGAFYQPKAVFIDLDVLSTLPEREVSTGLGEIIKYGIIYDKPFFSFLEDNARAVLSLETGIADRIISRSCAIKAEVVAADEKESGLRRILNFGHTIAHAIEKETGYVRYNHGEAVAIGMLGAARISQVLGMVDEATVQRVKNLIEALGLPTAAEGCTVQNLFADIFHDKKTVNGKVNWVLMESIGKVTSNDHVPEDVVKQCMGECLRA